MNSNLVFTNARLVLPDAVVAGSLSVQGGRIQALDSGATAVPEALDLDGDYLLPGLVEIHTDNFERHLMPRPKVQWAAAPALLAHDAEAGRLFNVWVNEHDGGHLAGAAPLLVMDVFEHAFMLDYGLKRADYIESFFRAIDWGAAAQRLK